MGIPSSLPRSQQVPPCVLSSFYFYFPSMLVLLSLSLRCFGFVSAFSLVLHHALYLILFLNFFCDFPHANNFYFGTLSPTIDLDIITTVRTCSANFLSVNFSPLVLNLCSQIFKFQFAAVRDLQSHSQFSFEPILSSQSHQYSNPPNL